jgi:hypothetical protein
VIISFDYVQFVRLDPYMAALLPVECRCCCWSRQNSWWHNIVASLCNVTRRHAASSDAVQIPRRHKSSQGRLYAGAGEKRDDKCIAVVAHVVETTVFAVQQKACHGIVDVNVDLDPDLKHLLHLNDDYRILTLSIRLLAVLLI